MRTYPAAFLVACAGGTLLFAVTAIAATPICTESYERAQEEKAAGHLNAALASLKSCIVPSCPSFIREDCVRWLDQVESAVPTVVFAVRFSGQDLTVVDVSCDGKPLVRLLDGKGVEIDPGPHRFTFDAPGVASVEQRVVIREGERNRLIEVDLPGQKKKAESPTQAAHAEGGPVVEPTEARATARYVAYGLAGLGALGGAGFALFGSQGNSAKSDLDRTCSPNCQPAEVTHVKTKYLLADTCLALGLLSASAATYLLLTHHGQSTIDSDHTTTVGFAPRTSDAGGVVQLAGVF